VNAAPPPSEKNLIYCLNRIRINFRIQINFKCKIYWLNSNQYGESPVNTDSSAFGEEFNVVQKHSGSELKSGSGIYFVFEIKF
jgi:hypothetical protein